MMLYSPTDVLQYPTLKETLNQVGGFQMSFCSKIFSNEIPHGALICQKGKQNRPSFGGMGTGPPLHLPECPTEPSGPCIPVCNQPCPTLTFYEATGRNPRFSQNPFLLFRVFPDISTEAVISICDPGALVGPLGHVTQVGHSCLAIHNSRYNSLSPQAAHRHSTVPLSGNRRLPPALTRAAEAEQQRSPLPCL